MENLTNNKIKYSTPDLHQEKHQDHSSSQEDSHSISFSDLVLEGSPSTKPSQSPISTDRVFASTDQITQYLQKSKGYDYDIVKDGDASLIVACRSHHSCPFHLKVAKSQGLWTFSGESSWPNHDHALKASTASEMTAPFRSRLTATNPVAMYSTSTATAATPVNLKSQPAQKTQGPDQTPNNSIDLASSIELMLKKRVKEIKETFKRIDDRLKLKCADEVLQLLRSRCKDQHNPNNSSAFESLLVGESNASALDNCSPMALASTNASEADLHSSSMNSALDFPSFSIAERKRKTVGTYKCRICRKEGHNSRSCDALQQQHTEQNNAQRQSAAMALQQEEENELMLVPEVLLLQQQSQRSKKIALQADRQQERQLGGMPAAGTLINQTLAIDEDMIREALLRPHEGELGRGNN